MSRQFYLIAAFTAGLLTVAPSTSAAQAAPVAQAPTRVTLEFEGASFRDVVAAFAKFSGRTIVVRRDVGDPKVSGSFTNVEWQRALEDICAKHGMVLRVSPEGILSIVKREPASSSR